MNIPKTVRQQSVNLTFWAKEKKGWENGVFDFRSETGGFGVVEEGWNTQGRQILARQLRNMYVASRPLSEALLFKIFSSK